MSKFHLRIKELRISRKLSQQELADYLKISKSSVNMYERGEREPGLDMIEAIADFFNVDLDYLMGKSNIPLKYAFNDVVRNKETEDMPLLSPNEKSLVKKYRQLDSYGKQALDSLLEIEFLRCGDNKVNKSVKTIRIKHSIFKVSAGHGFDLGNDDEWEEIDIPDTYEAQKADFALTIQGDSMEPIYSNGQIVLVKSQSAVDIGETGIYIINGSGFIKKNGGDRLISLNPKYDDIVFSDNDTVSCAGKVIGIV